MAKKKTDAKSNIEFSALQLANSVFEYALMGKKEAGVYDLYKRGLTYRRGKSQIKNYSERQGNKNWNKFGEVIKTTHSNLTADRPKWFFKPQDNQSDVFLSDALNQIIGDVIWDTTKWGERGKSSILDCMYAGSTHIKTTYDKITGFPIFTVVKCPSAYPDPKGNNAENRRFFIHTYRMNVQEIKDIFKADVSVETSIDSDHDSTSLDDVSESFELTSAYTMPSQVSLAVPPSGGVDNYMPQVIGQATIRELWIEDFSYENIPFKDSEVFTEHQVFASLKQADVSPQENHPEHVKSHTEYLQSIDKQKEPILYENVEDHITAHLRYEQVEKRRKYPNGRVIFTCQDKVLKDVANPLPIYFSDQYIKWDWEEDLMAYWGIPPTQDLFDLQDLLDHRKNSITKNINNINNGIVKVRRKLFSFLFGDGNKKKIVKDVEGHVIPVDNPDDVTRENGPGMAAHVVNDPILIEQFMERIASVEDLMSGRYPAGSPTGGTVETLLNQAQRSIHTVKENYAIALTKMARNAIRIMDKYVSNDTKFKILVSNEFDETGKQVFKSVEWRDLKDGFSDRINDVRVDVINQAETTLERKLQRAIALKREQIYDNQAVLDYIDDPKKYEILQRTSEIMQLRMLGKMQEQQIDQLSKELNTARNAAQGSSKESNVGTRKTSD